MQFPPVPLSTRLPSESRTGRKRVGGSYPRAVNMAFVAVAACGGDSGSGFDADGPGAQDADVPRLPNCESGAPWEMERTGAGGYWSAMAATEEGEVHVVYLGSSGVGHAWRAAGVWQTEVVASDVDTFVYGKPGIAVAADSVHIAFSDGGVLMHGRKAGGSWSTAVADGDTMNIEHVALAADEAGGVHASYTGLVPNPVGVGYDQHLFHAYLAPAGGWTLAQATGPLYGNTSDGWLGYSSVAARASGVAHVALRDDYASIGYATNSSGTWFHALVDDDRAFTAPSLAIDALGSVHIAFFDVTPNEVRYVRLDPFQHEEVADSYDSRSGGEDLTSIAVDAAGEVHVVFGVATDVAGGGQLRYARGPGSWSSEAIDGERTGFSAAVVVDGSGQIHVTYIRVADEASTGVIYARPCP